MKKSLMLKFGLSALLSFAFLSILISAQVSNQINLPEAIANSSPGDMIRIPAGTYELAGPLTLKEGITLLGEGPDKTILKASPDWSPGFDDLPRQDDPEAYLLKLMKTKDILIADVTLTGPSLHGAIYADDADGLELKNLHIKDFQWSGVRTFRMDNLNVHDCVFTDAGGKFQWTGGALYLTDTKNSEFWNNRIVKSEGLDRNFYGFKGQRGDFNRFHHNDVRVNFSLELPFENDKGIEIDHNRFDGAISIPKFKGGPVYKNELSFHIHHNWLKNSYALEWARNSAEIDHNLFDFNVQKDGGNLISNFSSEASPGPTLFHDNLIKNPGRGIFWTEGAYNRFHFYNNHVKSNGKKRREGFFGLNSDTNFETIMIRNNIIENIRANPRPLMRNQPSYQALIENNTLVNISDTDRFNNNDTGAVRGPVEPLRFQVGVNGEYLVDDWSVKRE